MDRDDDTAQNKGGDYLNIVIRPLHVGLSNVLYLEDLHFDVEVDVMAQDDI